MSKDQFTVHDDPTMKPKTIDVQLGFKDKKIKAQITNAKFTTSAKEYVDEQVKLVEQLRNERVESVEYWVNVKADK